MAYSNALEGLSVKRAVLYLRVSTQDQTTANQERELREIAGRPPFRGKRGRRVRRRP